MPYLKRTEQGSYEKQIRINGEAYIITIPSSIWEGDSIRVSRHIKYCINQIRKGKEPNVKYGKIQKIQNISESLLCEICNKHYKSRSGLLRHIKQYHSEETPEINERTISTQTDDISVFEIDEYETIDPSESIGYVYCFSCESMPGIYKIGMTTRNVEDRLVEANKPSTWKIPDDYKHILSKRVCNPYKKEQLIHKLLKDYRVTQRREFFKLPLVQIKCLFALLTEASTDESTE